MKTRFFNNSLRLISIIPLIVIALARCAGIDKDYKHHNNGTTIGSSEGSGPSRVRDRDNRRYDAPVQIDPSTALASDRVKDYMNQQRQEMQRELSEGLQSRSIVVQFLNDHTLHLTLPSQEFFDIYNANIHANYQSSLTKVLSVISKFDKTVIHIIVHTDNTGTENYNRILSQHQANAVADFLNSHGVDNTRLRVEGRGEDFPLFSNESKEGRQHNRRIELFLKPIIEGKIDWAFWPPN